MELRPATLEDAPAVLSWRNDPVTRAMSRDGEPVDEAAHRAWFAQMLADPSRRLLIGEAEGAKLGMVRIDQGAETEVSINLNPHFHGRGLSHALLAAALETAPGPLVAVIKQANAASIRLFERAGFVLQAREGELLRFLRP